MVNAFNIQAIFFRTTIAILLVVVVLAELEHKSNNIISNDNNRNLDTSSKKYHQKQNNRFLQVNQSSDDNEKAIQIQSRPKEINVDPRSTYNEKFMALMSSPCRPEYDGFFGATSGEPIRIQYGFQLEVQPFSVIMDILDLIEDRIVDSILMNTFPEMCGLRRTRRTEDEDEGSPVDPIRWVEYGRRSGEETNGREEESRRSLAHVDGHPSGFRFLKFEEVASCVSQVNEVNFCGVFTGVGYVYGKHQQGNEASLTVMSYIDQVLNTSVPQELHSDLALIYGVDEYSTINGELIHSSTSTPKDTIHNDGDGLSRLDILLIIVSSLVFLAIIYYFYIQWSERKYDGSKSYANDSYLTNNIAVNNQRDDFIDEEFVDDDDDDLSFEPY